MDFSKDMKIKMLIYTAISALGFSYMIMPENAGISVPVFVLIQIICMFFITPDKKRLLFFIPILILSSNSFFSASNIWSVPNFIICVIMISCMFFKFDFKNDSLDYFSRIGAGIIDPLLHFCIPWKWVSKISSEKVKIIERVFMALIITVPCTLILICVLASADMVFSMKTGGFISDIFEFITFNVAFKLAIGIVAGLYLFGVLYGAYTKNHEYKETSFAYKGDLIIINILLSAILFVYTLFVIIQFKYLFAGSVLPEGLTYTEYARKGFFELLALTGVNIAIIFAVTNLLKPHDGKWATLSKVLCTYLCSVTVVLLISSFYRMLLYTNDDGLTRLRLFVLGFLAFELLGLIITFIYIIKPKFNITLIYTIIALTYYMVLNIVPYDCIIAKNQIDKYLKGERQDIAYVFTLSTDIVPAFEYLLENTDDELIKTKVKEFITVHTNSDIPHRWQRYNLSVERAKKFDIQH